MPARRPLLIVATPLLLGAALPASLVPHFSPSTERNERKAYARALPLPDELRDAYDFWVRVYSEWTSAEALLHRDRSYELRTDALGQVQLFDTGSDFVKRYSNKKLLDDARAAGRPEYWRMQRGMSDLVLTALQTYHFFRDPMEEAIAPLDAPRDLLALGFLESLYNPYARSHTGALGVFQIQPWEGYKLGAVMGPAYNELLDPIASARLAVKKLLTDRELLRAEAGKLGIADTTRSLWPLVLTGYNQGIHAVREAVIERRTVDYLALVFREREGRFGFAGRNFYVQFRVFADFLRNVRPSLDQSGWPTIDPHVELEAGAYLDWPTFTRVCRLPPSALKALNLGITDLGWEGVLRLPPQARLRFPRAAVGQVNTCLAGPGREAMHEEQITLAAYRVRKGETLTSIAEQLGCSPFDLMQVNGIDREAASRLPVGALVQVPTRRYAELGQRSQAWKKKGRPMPKAFFPYSVRAGDTVQALQQRHKLAHPELSKWNEVEQLQAGQKIYIPEYD